MNQQIIDELDIIKTDLNEIKAYLEENQSRILSKKCQLILDKIKLLELIF